MNPLIFGESRADAENYDRLRPRYTPALFEAVLGYAGNAAGGDALEVGVGAGEATEPFLRAGWRVTAVEINAGFAAYAARKFRAYPGFSVVRDDFARFPGRAGGCDLLYSATAFHWIPEEIAYPRARRLLRPGGALALFWNHPFVGRAGDPVHCALRKAYAAWYPGGGRAPAEFDGSACEEKIRRLMRCGFTQTAARLFHAERELDAAGYLALLNTYSDHRALPREAKDGLERAVREAIDENGGRIRIYDTMDLYLARV